MGHVAIWPTHMTMKKGGVCRNQGLNARFFLKVGFCYGFWIFIDYLPDINGFSPFLGDIGHFWSPNSWRKLEMRNQLQGYIN